jgi:hypothetical protein
MKLIAASIGMAFLFVGCSSTSQPEFDPNKLEVKSVDGKQYKVPAMTSISTIALGDTRVKFYNDIGLPACKKGDITWETYDTADAVNVVMRSGSKSGGKEIYIKAAKEGKVGCASPL